MINVLEWIALHFRLIVKYYTVILFLAATFISVMQTVNEFTKVKDFRDMSVILCSMFATVLCVIGAGANYFYIFWD